MNYNKCLIGGNLTRDIELRYLPSGSAVGNFGIAINRKWRDAQGGEKSEVSFLDCVAFGKQAETLSQYVKKGSPLFLEARARTESWEDKNSGQKRSKTVFVVEGFQFLGSKPEGQRTAPRPAPTAAPADDAPPMDNSDPSVPF